MKYTLSRLSELSVTVYGLRLPPSPFMSLVDLRVDLPAYSRSFLLKVNLSDSILQVKEEIYRTCPGQPRPEGQRLIWRGRILADNEMVDDLWKVYSFVLYLIVSL